METVRWMDDKKMGQLTSGGMAAQLRFFRTRRGDGGLPCVLVSCFVVTVLLAQFDYDEPCFFSQSLHDFSICQIAGTGGMR